MPPELDEFVRAYIAAVHKRFEEAITLNQTAVTEGDRAFFDGVFFCYQDTMKMLKAELEGQDYPIDDLEPIVPIAPEMPSVTVIPEPEEDEIL
ncbi:MAG: hypothetical protein AAF289_20780 [Cyanobacteria bacterium P01_A01_bin.135]